MVRAQVQLLAPEEDSADRSLSLPRTELEIQQANESLLLVENSLPNDTVISHGDS